MQGRRGAAASGAVEDGLAGGAAPDFFPEGQEEADDEEGEANGVGEDGEYAADGDGAGGAEDGPISGLGVLDKDRPDLAGNVVGQKGALGINVVGIGPEASKEVGIDAGDAFKGGQGTTVSKGQVVVGAAGSADEAEHSEGDKKQDEEGGDQEGEADGDETTGEPEGFGAMDLAAAFFTGQGANVAGLISWRTTLDKIFRVIHRRSVLLPMDSG